MKVKKQQTITRDSLARAVKRNASLNLATSCIIVDDVFSIIVEHLCKNTRVKLRNFGSFDIKHKKERMGRNPRTLEAAVIPARYVVTFKIAPSLKKKIQSYALYNKDYKGTC